MQALILAVMLAACGRVGFDAPSTSDAAGGMLECPAMYKKVYGVPALALGPLHPGVTWASAVMACVTDGQALATPRSRFEALAMVDHAPGIQRWTGISQVNTPGTWTLDGQPATYLPWSAGEPDSSGQCVYMGVTGGFSDIGCQTTVQFFCECRATR